MPMVDRDLTGCTLGEFELRELIGSGGFGAVYRSYQPSLRREVVVKVLHARHHSDVALQRFEQEALLASRLDHPYAAHVYKFGAEDDGTFWIAMEMVQGITLGAWLKQHGPIPLDQFVPFFERVAEVVNVAHQRGIVHRDLKPSNIMVIERGGAMFPKLLDFGSAHVTYEVTFAGSPSPNNGEAKTLPPLSDSGYPGESQATESSARVLAYRLTQPGDRLGSAPYMSPEQWSDASKVGAASDLYALGVVAYEALQGDRPFFATSLDGYRDAHRDAAVPSTGSDKLDQILRRALAKSAGDRHHDALDLAAEFRAALRASRREQLRWAAQQWADLGRLRALLWRGAVLADLRSWTNRKAPVLSELECSFVAASQRLARQLAWLRRFALAALLLAIFGAAQYRAELQAERAEERAAAARQHTQLIETQSHLEQGRSAQGFGCPSGG
jgi:serine/threonine-protein kinase